MSKHFQFYVVDGFDRKPIEADSIELEDETGQKFELHPRRSDGKVIIYTNRRLAFRPESANSAEIWDES